MAADALPATPSLQAGRRFPRFVARPATPAAAAGTSPAAPARRHAIDPIAPPPVFQH